MIAQTETSFADNLGNLNAWKKSGVVSKKRWLLSNDHDHDDDCDRNAKAGDIGLDDNFPTGDPCPPQHPRCTCGLRPVVTFDQETP